MKFPWEILKKAHALGLVTANIPEAYGGGGLGVIEACILAEGLSYGCSGILTAITGSGLAVRIMNICILKYFFNFPIFFHY